MICSYEKPKGYIHADKPKRLLVNENETCVFRPKDVLRQNKWHALKRREYAL